jgi:signal peptidase I
MTLTQWLIFFIVINLIHGLATFNFYKKAGKEVWKAFVPFINMYELMDILNRPKWWMIFVYIPIVNLLMMPVLWVQTLRVFGKDSSNDMWLAVFSLGLYVAYVNIAEGKKLNYIENYKNDKETLIGSLIFAIIAATIVHTYFMQPYTIPTASLEKSLLVGDYLFVSKFHYGARPPMTTVAMPMVHDTIPIIKTRSYLKFPQLPYMRLPGFQKIKRNDIVVFNWPADTVKYFFQKDIPQYKPIDKKSHYVKRCVAVAGDSLQIKNGVLYINGKKAVYPDRTHLQHLYLIQTKKDENFTRNTLRRLVQNYDIKEIYPLKKSGAYLMNLTDEKLNIVKQLSNIESITLYDTGKGEMFGGNKDWDINNFGPVYIPKKGDVVKLNKKTYPFYKWIISRYDDHDAGHKIDKHQVELKGNDVYIDGKLTKEYTVKQDYYWMMGDNRSQSEDSRFWGFVPFDHVVGKPVFIFMSIDNDPTKKALDKIRWDRVFTTVSGNGKRVSYLLPFIGLILLYYGGKKFIKKKKE